MSRKRTTSPSEHARKFTKLTVRLDADLAVRLKVLSALERVPLTRLVQEALRARCAGLRLPGVVSPAGSREPLLLGPEANEDAPRPPCG